VSERAGADPKADAAAGRGLLQVIDDQGGFAVAVDEEVCRPAPDDDLHLDPFGRVYIRIGFILPRKVRSEPLPRMRGMRDVLDCMVPAKLIVGMCVGRA